MNRAQLQQANELDKELTSLERQLEKVLESRVDRIDFNTQGNNRVTTFRGVLAEDITKGVVSYLEDRIETKTMHLNQLLNPEPTS